MQYQLGVLATCAALFVYVFLRRHRRLSVIKDVPGPVDGTEYETFQGHQWYFQSEDAGGAEKRLLENFGNTVRWNGPFGENRLWVADPKAINHIHQKSGHLYLKQAFIRERSVLVADRGILWAQGDVHKRQRRAMAPAFGLVEARGLLPYFVDSVTKMADKWSSIIEKGKPGHSAVIDVNVWFGKATLDAIGAGAFEYDFGALDDSDNPLTKSYRNLIFASFGNPSRLRILFMYISGQFPGLMAWVYDNFKYPGMQRIRQNKEEAHKVARKLLDSKRQELKDGTPRKDVMSLLVKASVSQRQDWRLTDEEIISQVRTIMLAGHETTSKTLTFGFWELAKHHDFQEKLRVEINEALAKVKERGDVDFTANDFETMPHLMAFTKELLRIHPVILETARVLMQDDALPLTKPIVGTSGRVYTELPVPKGTNVTISVTGYNLNQDLWGPDAYEFRPERWLETNEHIETPVGVYGNLATFSGGARSCIGWRFAVLEIQAFLVTLVRKFDISLPDHHPQIRRSRSGPLVPLVLGEEYKGVQLPLKITAIRDA